ncbi:phenylalanine--tRNA ligase subunit beta [bacterium]|nr:phenylalanine--tRNA ligase subunit beta [bacterium]
MKISYNWLKSLIQVPLSLEEVCDKLTMSGLEVEHVIETSTIPGGLKGLVVGHIVEAEKHPNADRLKLTKVDTGNGELLDIVCGAPNVETGQKVIVAPVGTTIYPIAGEPFTIKKAKIRGERSEGMLCAEDEIGLGESHEGLKILPETAKVGTSVAELFEVESDTQIEIAIIPNRGDAVSHLGVARELQALTGTRYRLPGLSTFDARGPMRVDVEIKSPEACPRYAGISISGVEVKESPNWLKNRLLSIGLKPINNLVDITNYILHETGQPLHAFDLDKIEGRKIVVRYAEEGEKLTTLDEEERKLEDFNLMICDQSRPMAFGGVFGGLDSGVTERTRNVFIESAYFNPAVVRKTAKHFGLNTDASYRFERGTDPNMVEYALKRAVHLILDLAGGEVASELVDVYPNPIPDHEVSISLEQLNKFCGHEIPKDDVISILQNLEIKIAANNGDNLMLRVPPYRSDVLRTVDIYEEILRVYGFDKIPIPDKVNYVPSVIEKNSPSHLQQKISNYLADLGLNEIISNSLTAADYYNEKEQERAIELLNPLSSDMGIMRMNLLHSSLESIAYNLNRKNLNLKFFEFGKVYFKKDNGFVEHKYLQITATGKTEPEHWSTGKDQIALQHLLGIAENIFKKLNIPEKKHKSLVRVEDIDAKTLKKHQIKQEVHSICIDWQACLNHFSANFTLEDIPKFPVVRRDVSLVTDNQIAWSEIEQISKKTFKNYLRDIQVFDLYEGKPLAANEKSLSIAFYLYHPERTMKDEETDKMMEQLMAQFESQLNAKIRR